MLEILEQYFLVLLALGVINGTIYYTYLWQLKEYRLDRFIDMLKMNSGARRLLAFQWWGKMAIFGVAVLYFVVTKQALITEIIILLGFLIDPIDVIIRGYQRKIYRPDATVKAMMLMGVNIGVMGGLIYLVEFRPTLSFVILMLLPVILSLIVMCFYPVTTYMKQLVIKRAKHKIIHNPQLKVVGITGSYGKSSCKEFLSTILEQKFKVLKTPGNVNVDVGVARVVLRNLTPQHEVMVCEMGAYKKGEIAKICDIVNPDIGVITAVKDSHLSLFGSLEKIKEAKYELIEALPENGLGIFNADTEGSMALAKKAKSDGISRVVTYSLKDKGKLNARNIEVEAERILFEFGKAQFEAQLNGKQNIPNLLAAIIAARKLGMSYEEIAEAVKKIEQPAKVMQLQKVSDELQIVDDGYNANPDGVIAALDYLSIFEEYYKIIVFPGMLELGDNSDDEHQRVARRIAKVCDFAVFTSEDFERQLKSGLQKMGKSSYAFISDDQDSILALLKKKISQHQKVIVLFESRGAEKVMKTLCAQN